MPRGIPRDQSTQRKVLHRMKIARGHLDKVILMVENGDYCIDVVHQSDAVQAALKKANQALLENHLRHCLMHEVSHGHSEDMVEELMEVIKNA